MDLLDRELDAAIGRTRKTDLAVPIVAAEIFEPIVIDAQNLVRGLGVVELGGAAMPVVKSGFGAARGTCFSGRRVAVNAKRSTLRSP
jgi:hypothetical protein